MKTMNDHVEPYWNRCKMCDFQFDIIAKFESIEEDTKYIFEKVSAHCCLGDDVSPMKWSQKTGFGHLFRVVI
jgi:hypothetical protein